VKKRSYLSILTFLWPAFCLSCINTNLNFHCRQTVWPRQVKKGKGKRPFYYTCLKEKKRDFVNCVLTQTHWNYDGKVEKWPFTFLHCKNCKLKKSTQLNPLIEAQYSSPSNHFMQKGPVPFNKSCSSQVKQRFRWPFGPALKGTKRIWALLGSH
jgi:hypothetical protein